MLNGKRVIAVIPARGGSKSVPGKNIRSLGGKPLLAWSIDVARQVSEIDRIIVSTDDTQIASVGRIYGAEVYARPQHLATDEALVIDAALRYPGVNFYGLNPGLVKSDIRSHFPRCIVLKSGMRFVCGSFAVKARRTNATKHSER